MIGFKIILLTLFLALGLSVSCSATPVSVPDTPISSVFTPTSTPPSPTADGDVTSSHEPISSLIPDSAGRKYADHFKLSDFSVSPTQVLAGNLVTISATIRNIGFVEATHEVRLLID